jgi:hypothetical protein
MREMPKFLPERLPAKQALVSPKKKPFLRTGSCGASFFRALQLWQSQPLFKCVNAGI